MLFSGTARAQTDSERADRVALLRQADAARSTGHFEEALGFAQRAERIGVTAGTRFLLSQVHAGLRHWVTAHDAAEDCLRAVESDNQTSASNRRALRGECGRVRDEARQHLGRLIVSVPANAPRTMEVRVNGEVLLPGLFNLDRFVESGRVIVSATLAGAPAWRGEVTVNAGSRTSVDVVVPAVPEAPRRVASNPPPTVPSTRTPEAVRVRLPSPPPAVAPDEDRPSSTQRTLGWVGVGTGAALLVGAAVAGGVYQATVGTYADQQCEVIPANSSCQTTYDRFGMLNTLQWIGYVAGGVLAGTGVVLILTAPRRNERPAPTISVSSGPGLLGASLSGRF